MNCGVMADGCGGLVTCGVADGGGCPAGEECGGAGTPNVCGSSNVTTLSDGAVVSNDSGVSVCVPFTTTEACAASGGGSLCGPVSNGCGGTITCPACTGTDSCGGGGVASVCGHPACVEIPQATACANPAGGTYCGLVSNGCGGNWQCSTCTGSNTCGGGGVASMCGQPPCTPLTECPINPANGLRYNCGPWPDGCGNTIECGTCTAPNICGGGGQPSQCGDSVADAGASCDAGLKCDFPVCDGGTNTTTLSGYIYDPAGKNPLYNVVVYIPNSTPDFPLTHGVPSCDTCASLYTGDPVSATTTDTTGFFTLTNVPVPASGNVPIVIQVGKWRRQMMWPAVQKCVATSATPTSTVGQLLRLPGKESAIGAVLSTTTTIDELPQIAVSTGGADSMECLFQRIGFDATEYASGISDAGAANGHIHIFQGSSSGTATEIPNAAYGPAGNTTPRSKSGLWSTTAELNNYDIVILSCEGEETRGNGTSGQLDSTDLSNLVTYTTNGGRVFASHFHYAWFNQGTFGSDNLGTWVPATDSTNGAATYASSNPIYNASDDQNLNAKIITTLADGGTFARGEAMYQWLGGPVVNALTANELPITTPRYNVSVSVAASNTVSQAWLVPDNAAYTYTDLNGNSQNLPSGTTQYMSFNTPVGGTGDAGAPYCGRAVYSDLHVGGASGDYSGYGQGQTPTAPTDCADGALSPQEKALEFMLLDLASCVSSDSNLPPQPQPVCTPLTACPANYTCGEYPNGCGDGGFIQCGACEGGATCINGQCKACTPLTACPAGETCGEWPDGCGGILNCGTCAATSACIDGTCSTGCTPLTACPSGINCGVWANGCGGTIACGTCTGGDSCGGGGTPGVCGQGDADVCNGFTCAGLGLQCGPAGNGCGGTLSCGDCPAGETCGGGGVAGVCGAPNCTPKTCAQLGANCGQVADGCGGLTADCGTCTGNATCSGGGTANQCGVPPCTPRTCAEAGANCGPVADGCGGTLQCGTCVAPDTCGGGGTISVCGTSAPK
jgi:hypothetical protein